MIPELRDAIHLDFETRSTVNLRQAGPFVYGENWATDIWCACFARGDGPIQEWRPGDPVPDTIARAAAEGIPFVAHNVSFERAIIKTIAGPRYGWPILPIARWYCTAAMAAAMSLPRKLEDAAVLMGCDAQKDMVGHRLMLKMMKPSQRVKCLLCSGTGHVNGGLECGNCGGRGVLLYWHDSPNDIARLTAYCGQDVATERDLCDKLYPLPPLEREIWMLDQTINERGVQIDLPTVKKAQKIVKEAIDELNSEMKEVTGSFELTTNKVTKLRLWLACEGLHVENLRKDTIVSLLKSENLDELVKQALELRQEAAKTSTAKLNAFANRTCEDGRMRDNLVYCGAATGRFSGRGAQLQNLPSRFLLKPYQVEAATKAIADGWEGEDLRRWFDTPLETVSACLRGMVVAAPGNVIYAGDYNAIEARGTAWLAGAEDMLGVFQRGEDPYLFQAAKTYKYMDLSGVDWSDRKSVADVKTKYDKERKPGKVAVLGLGYQMGWPKYQASCAKERIFVSDEDAQQIVFDYRQGNPEIPALWSEMQDMAIQAVVHPDKPYQAAEGRITFLRHGTWLYMRLPSGRLLYYARPALKKRDLPWIDEATGVQAQGWGVTYWGMSSITHKWSEQHAYGGKWVENAVQALCRDILACAMIRLERSGYPIVVSVHDEAVSEVPEGFGSVKEYETIMAEPLPWSIGMPIVAEGWCGKRYRK